MKFHGTNSHLHYQVFVLLVSFVIIIFFSFDHYVTCLVQNDLLCLAILNIRCETFEYPFVIKSYTISLATLPCLFSVNCRYLKQ